MDEIVATGIKFTTANANPCHLQLVILDRHEGQLLTTTSEPKESASNWHRDCIKCSQRLAR
jgi:hypothetical protein